MKEAQIQKAVREYLEYMDNLGRLVYIRSGAGAIKTEAGHYFKTGRKGWPDNTVLMNGVMIGVETKSPTGKQSKAQKEIENKILAAGGLYYIVRSVEDVIKVIEKVRINKRLIE